MRLFHSYNQLELATKLDVSRSYISEIESDIKIPTIEFLQKYADFFNIPLSTIILFAENHNNATSIRGKSKRLLTTTAVKFLEWICKAENGEKD